LPSFRWQITTLDADLKGIMTSQKEEKKNDKVKKRVIIEHSKHSHKNQKGDDTTKCKKEKIKISTIRG
jgi:hypothetical protein